MAMPLFREPSTGHSAHLGEEVEFHHRWHAFYGRIRPAKAVCPDLLIGFKSMPYVMCYNHFPH